MSAFGVKRTTTNREKIPHNCSSYREENQTAARHGEATTELTAVEPRRAALIDQLDLALVSNRDGWSSKKFVRLRCLRDLKSNDFLLSTTLRRLDYRKIPSRFLEP
jgi:hypothetical protein